MFLVILAFIAIASSLIWYLLGHDHGRRLPVEALWLACGFGALAMVLAAFTERSLIPASFLQYPQAYTQPQQLGYFLLIAIVEETVKFLPLALFVYRKSYFREHVDGVIYFAVCGLAFGLGENILYTASYGAKVGMSRLLLTPFLHAATTAILGYYLIHMRLRRPHARWLMASACLAVPILHGVYDFGIGSPSPQYVIGALVTTLLLTQALFLYFLEANALDRLARVPTLATQYERAANYCEKCGQTNQRQGNYCEACGHEL